MAVPSPQLEPQLYAAGGSATADSFSALYAQRCPDVLRWLRALGGREAELEDLAQEVFVIAHRRFASFDGLNAAGWLYKIAENVTRNHRRHSWFRNFFAREKVRADPENMPGDEDSPSAALEQKERQCLLYTLIGRLGESRRATFCLFEVEGYSGEEIAEMQNIPLNTVWTRLHLARKEFLVLAEAYRLQGVQGGESEGMRNE